jgi:Ser-tRNA(Ala) deacylase AlaX
VQCAAIVREVSLDPATGKSIIILDQTVFYPQGGGQPYDQGIITGPQGTFVVEQVRFIDGVVKHSGQITTGTFTVGETVQCTVDQARRSLHSRLHSAGHVVDRAVQALALAWAPGKAYHFPEGPYVEYAGPWQDEQKEALRAAIEQKCNEYIAQAPETSLLFMTPDKMHTVCNFVPDNLPQNKPSRVVLYGNFGVPCGGTHVRNLAEIGTMTIRKVRLEKGMIRVSYALATH